MIAGTRDDGRGCRCMRPCLRRGSSGNPRSAAGLSALPLRKPGGFMNLRRIDMNKQNRLTKARTVCRALSLALSVFAGHGLAAAATGEWVSRYNGPTNANCAEGETLQGNWEELWRVSALLPRVLVKDGLVIVRNDPANERQIAAL